ncbi:alpha/beta hydrolase family protein [Actinomadura rupiterrae]|uniref:alpha/beta hydrolase family protein n=1 Tax=Actinomadura rupiterrae TaxID=559627 RepID=UPI0020A55640|nr:CocE/NonD family hydrolase [Actinomadura rupiterrae]MCP2340887.1 ABC-2 type transport system ATP-binding protein [Actinomadura rupiterrae]
MPRGSRRGAVAAAAALTAALPLAAAIPAHADDAPPAPRTVQLASFDGVHIVTNFFPAKGLAAGAKAPTVLLGHGWGGRAETDPAKGQLALLTSAGYNVVTWNARGFGSEGEANVDTPAVEGRDVMKIIDWTAAQPEVQLDRPGDPRLGMAGGSYGGGIQLVAAGMDRRVDVITPTIAFQSVERSLYRDSVYRAGWGSLLCLSGVTSGNRVAGKVLEGCASGALSGTLSPSVQKWFMQAGAGSLVNRIRIPTLVMQGTVDTLFTLREGLSFYRPIKANGAPVKMIWFCGGHGSCTTKAGASDHLAKATLAWFARYLKGDASADTGAGFEYIDQDGVYRTAASYPAPAAAPLKATGKGHLNLTPLDNSGTQMVAQPAKNALTVPIPMPAADGQAVGVPHLRFSYQGRALHPQTAVYAQIVDLDTGLVVGNQATPIPITLDGRRRTTECELEAVSWKVGPGHRLALQITPGTALFTSQKAIGWLDASKVALTVPTVQPGPEAGY